ncbi:MAG: hypothetical protein HYY17_12085 [Planctomycetes bacterium]|nr:hypothetical protein [Planctomycetota bacterium]
MSLHVELKSAKTDLLFQEDTEIELEFANRGGEPIFLLPPEYLGQVTPLRITEVRTGEERLYRRAGRPRDRERESPLAPGKSVTGSFRLLGRIPEPAPGEYELSAFHEHGEDANRIESRPVRIKVHPTVPRNVALDTLQGEGMWGAWMNLGAQPPDVVLTLFDVAAGGGVSKVLPLAKATLHTRPVLSLPVNRGDRSRPWIAWIDGGAFVFLRVSPGSDPGRIELPGSEAEIVPALYVDAAGTATALVWLAEPGGRPSRFQIVHLAAGEARLGACGESVARRPAWAMSHSFSDGTRLLTTLDDSREGATLSSRAWSESRVGPVDPLAAWKTRPVTAGATLNLNDVLHGWVLMREEKTGRLELAGWKIDVERKFAEVDRQAVEWPLFEPIDRSLVRVTRTGAPAVLLCDVKGGWWFHYRGACRPLPEPMRTTRLPLDVAFMGGEEPVLVCAEAGRGFRLRMMNGRPLPPSPL